MNTTTLGMESSNFIEVSPKVNFMDFCTCCPSGHVINDIAKDMKWEEDMKRQALNKTDYRKAAKN